MAQKTLWLSGAAAPPEGKPKARRDRRAFVLIPFFRTQLCSSMRARAPDRTLSSPRAAVFSSTVLRISGMQ